MPRPLLCELHAHTTWSDGSLGVRDLIDLYGCAGFDVLAITDHVVPADDAWHRGEETAVSRTRYDGYLAEIEAEAARAAALYGLLVLPGLELTYDSLDARRGAHAVAVGLREFISVDSGLDAALAHARAAGAALIAAHPYTLAAASGSTRTTARFAEEPDWAATVVDRFEVCNRHEFFDWVSRARVPVVANGDFHRPEHLETWKTLIPAEPHEDAVVEYLRSGAPVAITQFRTETTTRQAA